MDIFGFWCMTNCWNGAPLSQCDNPNCVIWHQCNLRYNYNRTTYTKSRRLTFCLSILILQPGFSLTPQTRSRRYGSFRARRLRIYYESDANIQVSDMWHCRLSNPKSVTRIISYNFTMFDLALNWRTTVLNMVTFKHNMWRCIIKCLTLLII